MPNVAASALDSARWIWELVGPHPRVLNATTLRMMMDFNVLQWVPGGLYPGGCNLDCN
eukprot:gene8386-11893_t